jgi:hypothetical protein
MTERSVDAMVDSMVVLSAEMKDLLRVLLMVAKTVQSKADWLVVRMDSY